MRERRWPVARCQPTAETSRVGCGCVHRPGHGHAPARSSRGRLTRLAACACLLTLSAGTPAVAQVTPVAPARAPDISDLDAVEVTAPRPPDADPFGFRTPPPPTRFDRAWREPFDLEEIGMRGGLVMLSIQYAVGKAAQGVSRLPGWKQQIRPATARPPPLDPDQDARAARIRAEAADGR